MDFDAILEEIGEFGRYQKTNYFLLCLPVMFGAANSVSYVFTAGVPRYRCLIPQCDKNFETTVNEKWLNNTIPSRLKRSKDDTYIPEPCLRFKVNESFAIDGNIGSICAKEMFLQNSVERCSEWIFDKSEKTILEEWQLTCQENAWKLALVGAVHFAGLVVGTALSGVLADRYGRKNIFIICITVMALFGIAQGLAWNYISFLIFAFLNAIGTSGVYPLAFIIGVEMVGPKKRELSSIVLNYFYAVGEAVVGLVAWCLHDWRLLQYALSIPPLLFVAYYWFVPESVRWLIAKDKTQKAIAIIHEAAKVNKKKISTALLASFSDGQDTCKPKQKTVGTEVKGVFTSKRLLIRYTIMMYIWIVNGIVFYGLSLNSTSLSGNKYFNFALVCLVEMPGYTLAWFALNKFGRKVSLFASLVLCAVTCVLGGYITTGSKWIFISLFLLGKFGITSSFAVLYTYTSEMMPTVVRSCGVGCMSTFARFGAMLAPFVPLLGVYFEPLPLLIFGVTSFSAGILALFLPETFQNNLPDTIEEAKTIGKKQRSTEKKGVPSANRNGTLIN